MLRIAFVFVGLTAIAVGLVQLHRWELSVRHDLQGIEGEHAQVRTQVWHREVEIGHLTSPEQIRYRAEVLALDLTDEAPPPYALHETDN